MKARVRAALPLAALLLLALMRVLLTHDEESRSHTTDEPLHLVRGVAYWSSGGAELSYLHPPLANATAALGVEDVDRVDITAFEKWEKRDPVPIALAYFDEDYEAAREDISGAREVMAWIAVLFAAYVFWWCRRRWGMTTGLVALALCAGHPAFLAHGGLVTTDLPATFGTFLVLTQFVAWRESPTPGRALSFGAAVGLLACTKHTGVVAFGLLGILAMGFALWPAATTEPRGARVTRVLKHFGLAAIVGVLAVNAAYRFEDTLLTVDEIEARHAPENHVSRRFDNQLLTPPAFVPGALPVPLPYTYVYGLATIRYHNTMGHPSFFAGRTTRGHPAYFPVLTAAKTPVGILALMGLALWLVVRRRVKPSSALVSMVAFGLLFYGLAAFSRMNLGVRHVMVVFPVFVVVAARAAVLGWDLLASRRWARPAIAACVVSASAAGLVAYPHFISHFNVLVGGRAGGHKISVVGEDWGQDNTELARWLSEQEVTRVGYATRGRLRRVELGRHGVEAYELECYDTPRPEELAVVPLTNIVRNRSCYPWRAVCEERRVINHHLYIYACPAGDRLEQIRWDLERRKKERAAESEYLGAARDEGGDEGDDARQDEDDDPKADAKKSGKKKSKGDGNKRER